jgi:hypothetical protein
MNSVKRAARFSGIVICTCYVKCFNIYEMYGTNTMQLNQTSLVYIIYTKPNGV